MSTGYGEPPEEQRPEDQAPQEQPAAEDPQSPPPQPASQSPAESPGLATRFCSNCGVGNPGDAAFCANCGTSFSGLPATGSANMTAAGEVIPPVRAGEPDRATMRRQGRRFTAYSPALMAFLSFITLGVFAIYWLNHWHGMFPNRRPDDWSTARAIWCLFIPIYSIYWLFESLLRLCTRLDEELAEANIREGVPKELVRWFCITELIPYANFIVAPILATIATASLQSQVNKLAEFDNRALSNEVHGTI